MFSPCHATSTTVIYTLSLHDALPILGCGFSYRRIHRRAERVAHLPRRRRRGTGTAAIGRSAWRRLGIVEWRDRKSTRLNSSHLGISYAVFCLKKKKKKKSK